MNRILKSVAVGWCTTLFTAGAAFLIGPQILIVVPTVLLTGIVLAIRRSFLSLVCFGYPLTFGIVSALIGCAEMDSYARTTAFAVSVVIGMAGVALIATGLWKALPGSDAGGAGGISREP